MKRFSTQFRGERGENNVDGRSFGDRHNIVLMVHRRQCNGMATKRCQRGVKGVVGEKFRIAMFLLCLAVNYQVVMIDAWSQPISPGTLLGAAATANDASLTPSTTRRSLLESFSLIVGSYLLLPAPSFAAETSDLPTTSSTDSLVSVQDIASLLHPTPTFCLVDPNGVPYMVVGEDAKVTGYFFTSFGEAQRVLQLARKSADKAIREAKKGGEEDVGDNPWTKARISTVPLDTAVTLVYKSSRTKGIYFKVAPSVDDVQDALLVSGQEDLAEGKVPLFYYEDFKDASGKSPLFFRRQELEQAWNKANNSKQQQDRPKLMVTELFSVLGELVRPTTGNATEDEELRNLVLQPPKESEAKAKECLKKGGSAPAFVIGQRIIVL